MGSEPLTFGASFRSLRTFVETRFGEGAFEPVYAAIMQRTGVELPRVVGPTTWHPTRAFTAGLDAACELYGKGDPRFFEEFGAAAAQLELSLIARMVLRFSSPLWMLKSTSEIWNKAHSTGRWEIAGERGFLRGTLYDFGVVHAGQCRSLVGWLTRASQMTGARNIRVEHPRCRASGAEGCEFIGRW